MDASQLNLTLLALGGYIILFGLFSYLLKERANMGEAPIAIVLGIVLGPHGIFNLLDWASDGDAPHRADALMLALSRIVLGVQLTLIGIQLPYRFLRTELVSLLVLIGPVMTAMWLATAACVQVVFPAMPLLVALVVAACTTATDPVLSNSIVKGQFADAYVSVRLRQLISAESGLNDGMGYPFLYIAVHLLREATLGDAIRKWTIDTLLWVIVGSVFYGIAVGYGCLLLLRFATRNGYIDKESFLLYGTGMAIFIVGSAGMLGTDDLLAAFIAGNVFTWDDRYRVDTQDDEVTNVIDLLLNQTFFLFVGLMVPFELFNQPEYGITPARLVVLSLLVLIFRRLPAMLLHYRLIPSIRDSSEGTFAGYFGPIGAGACFYASLVLEEFKVDDPNPVHQLVRIYVKPITYALVLASIAGHSLMIPVLKAIFVYYEVGRIKLDDSASDFDKDEVVDDVDGSDEAETRTIEGAAPSASAAVGNGTGNEAAGPSTRRPISAYSTSSLAAPSSLAPSSRTSVHSPRYRREAGADPTMPQTPAQGHSHSLPPRHFEPYDATTPSSWRLSSGHKLPSSIAHDERTGEEVYYLGGRDGPSAWTRAARRGERVGSRSRSRSRRRVVGQEADGDGQDLDGLERGDVSGSTANISADVSASFDAQAGRGDAPAPVAVATAGRDGGDD